VTATLYLPLPRTGRAPATIAAARAHSRDLALQPAAHLEHAPTELLRERAELVRRSGELRAHEPANHLERRLVFREIRRVNEQLLAADPGGRRNMTSRSMCSPLTGSSSALPLTASTSTPSIRSRHCRTW